MWFHISSDPKQLLLSSAMLCNRSRGSVGNAHQVTGPATSGVAWGQAEAGRSWGTARSAMLAVQTSAR